MSVLSDIDDVADAPTLKIIEDNEDSPSQTLDATLTNAFAPIKRNGQIYASKSQSSPNNGNSKKSSRAPEQSYQEEGLINYNPSDITRKSYMPELYYYNTNGLWRNGNQQSTLELCIYVRRKLTSNTGSYTTEEDYSWVQLVYDIIRTHSEKYGRIANNDAWCHHFTDEQLQNFYDLVENTK